MKGIEPSNWRSEGGLRRSALLALAGAAAVGLASCGAGSSDGKPNVASTAPQIDVLLHSLAGDGITVGSVVAATQDVHDIELRPSQAKALKAADLILRPGRGGDAWAQDGLKEVGGEQVDVASKIPGDERHWWMDPSAAIIAAETIVPKLDALDPDGASERAAALKGVRDALKEVDEVTLRCLDTVPAGRRAVVTDHDAIGSFADRYGLTVAATVAPGSNPDAAPSAQRVVEILNTIKTKRVAAIFPIAPHGGELVETLAKRASITLGRPLWADALPNAAHSAVAGDHAHDDEHRGGSDLADSHVADEGFDADHGPAAALVEAAWENASAVAEALRADSRACGSIMTG